MPNKDNYIIQNEVLLADFVDVMSLKGGFTRKFTSDEGILYNYFQFTCM